MNPYSVYDGAIGTTFFPGIAEMNFTGTTDMLSTADPAEEGFPPRSWFSSFLICFAAILSQILTIGGNILVLLSFKVERRLRKPSNYFLFSLAVADLIIGLFSMPVYSLYLLLRTWPFGKFVCDLWISIDYACSEVSVLNLIMISVDRLWSVKSPAKYRNKMNFRRALIMIIPTWVAPTLLYFTSIMGWTYITSTVDSRKPGDCFVPFMVDSPTFMTVSTIFVYWIPLMAMFIMYVMIFQIIRNLAKNKRRERDGTHRQQRPGNPLPHRSGPDRVCVIQPLEPTVLETEAHLGVTNDGTTTTTASTNCSDSHPIPSKPLILPGKMPDIESETEPMEDTSSSSRKNDTSGYPRDYQKAVLKPVEVKRDTKSGKFKSGMLSRRTKRRKSQRGERQSRSERKATRTLTFILGAFFVTWSPYSTIVIILAWHKIDALSRFYHFSYYLCYINSTVNPLCYAFANELFRNTFYKILSGRACKS